MRTIKVFQIAELIGGTANGRPYFITELSMTSDGMRTRICDGHYMTMEQAERALAVKEKLMAAHAASMMKREDDT